ncbi:MAG: ABC transporter permease [Acidimicrobiia bacterium]|nr:ABC transporter permease [Acidimicrobiia bacterium]
MNTLTGTGRLVRFIIRRDRIRLSVWILATVGLMASFAASSKDLYPTPESLQARGTLMDSPLGAAFSGPRIGLDNYTFGAMLSNEYVGFVAVALGLMSVFLVVRNTRVEEQTGRSELVRAAAIGRHAPATAAFTVVVGAQIVLGILIALILPGTGLDLSVTGSWLFSAAIVSVGIVFAGVMLVVVQIASHSRTAVGVGSSLVGLAYVIRAMGDAADSSLSMLSPIGWVQATRPYVEDEWWPLLLSVGLLVILVVGAFALSARRDFGEGLLAARPGNAEASPSLTTPLGLAWRLQRGLLVGWGIGLLALGGSYGGFVSEIQTFASQNPMIEEAMSALGGGTLAESWVSFLGMFQMGVVASYAVQSTLRLGSEETELHAEHVLATPVERWRWMGIHILIALVGSVILALAAGLGFGLSAGASSGDWAWLGDGMIATLSHVPAVLVVGAVAAALFGLGTRFTFLAWVMIAIVWLGLLGVVVGLPEWIGNLSPFGYEAMFPAQDLEWIPLLVNTLIAVALIAVGVYAYQQRDIRTTG